MSSENRNPDLLIVEEGSSPQDPEPTLLKKCLTWSGTIITYVLCHSCLSVYLLVIGAINLNNCPIHNGIPIWLIILASYTIARGVIEITTKKCTKEKTQTRVRRVFALTDIANVIYFIWGAVIIFSIYNEVSYDKESGAKYCSPWVYWTGFIVVLMAVITTAFAILAACCAVCCKK